MDGPHVEICGTAILCFNEEGNCFQGSITSDDNSQFAIYGTKSSRKRSVQGENPSDSCESFLLAHSAGTPVTFDIKVVDCEVGEEYSLKRVHGRNGELCTFSCSSVTFTTDKVYRGHRADLIAQSCLGRKMEGKRTRVFHGPIRLSCVATPRGSFWVL
ncbi:hypothetical protein SK128_012502 [Halocaridina rubra]|uniref:Uncharacterized protein n=1 Tax=Halocaridina rubra TaxID=373956 RepID=A0AAN8WMK8_HALRR